MKKAISIIHTLYIVTASVAGGFAIYNETFKASFKTENLWTLNIWVTVALIGISIIVVITQFMNPYVCGFFQKLWWIPQLIYVNKMIFSSIGNTVTTYSLYKPTMLLNAGFDMGIGEKSNLTSIGLNVIALIGLIIATRNNK